MVTVVTAAEIMETAQVRRQITIVTVALMITLLKTVVTLVDRIMQILKVQKMMMLQSVLHQENLIMQIVKMMIRKVNKTLPTEPAPKRKTVTIHHLLVLQSRMKLKRTAITLIQPAEATITSQIHPQIKTRTRLTTTCLTRF